MPARAGGLAIAEHWRALRDRGAVVPRLGRAEVDAVRPHHHGLAPAEVAVSRRHGEQLVAELLELHARLLGDERLDLHVAALERQLREAAGLEGFLQREAVVGYPGH